VVVVTRQSEYQELLARHGTAGQAAFFLERRGLALEPVAERHRRLEEALHQVRSAIPGSWRRAAIERSDLARFVFEDDDVVVAVGQDGLVANAAKYLTGQPVVGVNPDPELYDGVLVPHPPEAAGDLLAACAAARFEAEERTMVEARLDDGQRLLALNEVFVGSRTHQSARYRIAWRGSEERQSSSGLIVTTGTGSTGWALSISRQIRSPPELPAPTDDRLAFFVREAFPSVATGTSMANGTIAAGELLEVVSEMNDGGVVFGDGIEDDRLDLHWGRRVKIAQAETRLCLVRG
jgi:NAD kinase